LFDQLTRYQPYQPVAVGWKMTLVFNKEHQIYWAADEVFDAGDDGVANAARLRIRPHRHPIAHARPQCHPQFAQPFRPVHAARPC
jgi:hypothetical protein